MLILLRSKNKNEIKQTQQLNKTYEIRMAYGRVTAVSNKKLQKKNKKKQIN